jgi:hypothetical protein
MARWIFAVALLATSLSSAFAQDNRWSGGMLNGYAWRQMSEEAKTYYAAAVAEVSSTLEDSPRRPVNLEKCRCKLGQLVEGVDTFYKSAASTHEEWMRLPVLCVFTGESWRRSGEPLEKISFFYAGMLAEIENQDKAQKPPQ